MIRTAEPNDYAAEILFYLPQAADPSLPKLLHGFVLGEVQVKLAPSDPGWTNVALDHIVERGEGWYAIRLTTLQRATAEEVAYQAVCAGAQPDRGTEIIGGLSGDIAQNAAGELTFYLPDAADPIYGAPLSGHPFVLGEVKLSLPDDAFGNVLVANIVDRGGGLYGVLLSSTQTAKRGKAIVVANVTGAQRYSGYRTILGAGVPATPPPLSVSIPSSDDTTAVAGDLRLTWSNTTGDADLSLIDYDADLETDRGLRTAVLLSLFTDRRAEDDDIPPSGDANDRRGWWGDQFLEVKGDKYGSRLWLLDRSKDTNERSLRAIEYAREGLAWMIEDKVVAGVDVSIDATSRPKLLVIGLQRPGRDPVFFRFAHTWEGLDAG